MNRQSRGEVQDRLEDTLVRLKRETGLGTDLQVEWHPNPESDRHGEVKGSVIYVYDGGRGRRFRL